MWIANKIAVVSDEELERLPGDPLGQRAGEAWKCIDDDGKVFIKRYEFRPSHPGYIYVLTYERMRPSVSFDECAACVGRTEGADVMVGISCACGNHFHVEVKLLAVTTPLVCPQCRFQFNPVDIVGERG